MTDDERKFLERSGWTIHAEDAGRMVRVSAPGQWGWVNPKALMIQADDFREAVRAEMEKRGSWLRRAE